MKRRLLIGIVSCLLAMGMQAETVRVMRFVAVDGAEQEVAMGSLQKVVFSQGRRDDADVQIRLPEYPLHGKRFRGRD